MNALGKMNDARNKGYEKRTICIGLAQSDRFIPKTQKTRLHDVITRCGYKITRRRDHTKHTELFANFLATSNEPAFWSCGELLLPEL